MCVWQTVSDAEKFFLRKEGAAYLKRAAQDIMESADFQSENIGDDAKDQTSAIKMRRQEAMKRAKERYTEVPTLQGSTVHYSTVHAAVAMPYHAFPSMIYDRPTDLPTCARRTRTMRAAGRSRRSIGCSWPSSTTSWPRSSRRAASGSSRASASGPPARSCHTIPCHAITHYPLPLLR